MANFSRPFFAGGKSCCFRKMGTFPENRTGFFGKGGKEILCFLDLLRLTRIFSWYVFGIAGFNISILFGWILV
jgi:hypothetical protein